MYVILTAAIIAGMALIAWEDIRKQAFNTVWPLLVIAAFTVNIIAIKAPGFQWVYLPINMLFFVVNLGGVTLWFSIKNRKPVNILEQYLGLGDILIFLVLCFAFSPINLMVFFFISVFMAAITGIVISWIKGKMQTLLISKVPLAGLLAVFYLVALGLNNFDVNALYNDAKVKQTIPGIMMDKHTNVYLNDLPKQNNIMHYNK